VTLSDLLLKRRSDKPHKRPWLTSSGTLEILQKKSSARANDNTERKRLQGIFRAKAKVDCEAYFNRLADEAEVGIHHNDLKPAYKAIRRLRGDTGLQKNVPVVQKDGQPCSSQREVLQHWCEHCNNLIPQSHFLSRSCRSPTAIVTQIIR